MRTPGALERIGGDAMAVGLGQLAAFAYPIVSLPLLTRLLGVTAFGRVIISIAILQLIVRLCDYGFSVSAVRRLAVAKTKRERSEVITSTLLAVLLLWLAGAGGLLVIVSVIPSLRGDFELYLIGTLVIVCGIGFPSWLLQGLRRLRLFAVITAVSRIIALLGLIVTVQNSHDIGWAITWQFAPPLIASLLMWPILAHREVQWCRPSWRAARFALADGRALFFSSIAHSIMGSAPVVVLGIASAPIQAAHYGAAERFGNAGRGVLFAVTDALLPRMVDAHGVVHRGVSQTKLIMIMIFSMFALGGVTLILVAPWFVPWYLGKGFGQVVPVAQIIGLALIASGGVAVLMLDLNSQRLYSVTATAMMCGAAIHLASLIPMALIFGAAGAAWALVFAETFITGFLFFLRRRAAAKRAAEPSRPIDSPSIGSPPIGMAQEVVDREI